MLAFDKTFNLTEVHVTMAVYKNLAVYREGTQNHPIVMGPMFIHGTSDYETYGVFFDYLKRKLSLCTSPPVMGSDDEKSVFVGVCIEKGARSFVGEKVKDGLIIEFHISVAH